jgi:hypothetical protein
MAESALVNNRWANMGADGWYQIWLKVDVAGRERDCEERPAKTSRWKRLGVGTPDLIAQRCWQDARRPSSRNVPRISSALSIIQILLTDTIDAWLAGLTRPPGTTSPPARPPRCDNMADIHDGAANALPDMTPQPAPNPDQQATFNDFLDYTEFFPSDLQRSLRLIKKLDLDSNRAVQNVHELTVQYGKLPTVPADERPDPAALRRSIATTLEKAIQCRESSYAEAARLAEVAERHGQRIKIIKRKLQALPEPPSRDPTPVPQSPQASRSLHRSIDRPPQLRLTLDNARPRDRKRTAVPLPGTRARSLSSSDDSDSEARSNIDLAVPGRQRHRFGDKSARPPKSRVRIPGAGTNVHSSIAGISTSNALARLSPPPADARPGSRWAPWFKLTEYEMAVLRKKMKKNAVWTPSETMIKKQLEAGQRGQEYYEREKARCEAAGIKMIDEEPDMPSTRPAAPPPAAEEAPPPNATAVPPPHLARTADDDLTAVALALSQARKNSSAAPSIAADTATNKDDDGSIIDGTRLSKRESQRRQARLDVKELEDAGRRIKDAADKLIDMSIDFGTPPSSRKKSTARTPANHKRKRDSSPQPTSETPSAATREQSLASQDSGTKPPDQKRLRIFPPIAPAPASISTPRTATSAAPSPLSTEPMPQPESTTTTSIQVPLAPAGPSTPKLASKPQSKTASRNPTPAVPSPTFPATAEPAKSPVVSAPPPPQAALTAASTRSRRESVAPKAVSPPPAPAPSAKGPKAALTSASEAPQPAAALPTRPRSARGHVPTPKAQSEEPKPHEAEKQTRELRRHSVFSQVAIVPTRASSRRKPPPKGDVTAGEDGKKTVTNVKRAQGNKNKRKKKADEDPEPLEEEIDPDEPRYCICDDVSFGQMISCDNNVSKPPDRTIPILTISSAKKSGSTWNASK